MELALLVWGISLLNGIKGLLIFLAVIFFISGIGWSLHAVVGEEKYDGPARPKLIIGLFSACLLSVFLNILVPTEKTAYIMVGAYATQKISEDARTQEVGKKVLIIIEQKLDSYILEKAN